MQLQNEGPAGASITVWGLEGDGLEFKQPKTSLQGIASERYGVTEMTGMTG
jgi:hypothetical protein